MLCFYFFLHSKITPLQNREDKGLSSKNLDISVLRTMKLSKFGRLFKTAIFNTLAIGKQSAASRCGLGRVCALEEKGEGRWPAPAPGPARGGVHGALEPWEQKLPFCPALPLCLLIFLRNYC